MNGKTKLFRVVNLLVIAILIVVFGLRFQSIDLIKDKDNYIYKRKQNINSDIGSGYNHKIYEKMPKDIANKITGVSFTEGGPVMLEDLSYIQLTYWGFDAQTHLGEIMVHKELAKEVVEIFREIYAAKFPIARMKLIDDYQADDDLSMANNNTSGFCMRKVRGSNRYSKHSLGVAIDINPIQNPYLWQGIILPQTSEDYINRQNIRKGMIVKGDVVYKAFKIRGWTWGGDWKTLKDYQHFEKKSSVKFLGKSSKPSLAYLK